LPVVSKRIPQLAVLVPIILTVGLACGGSGQKLRDAKVDDFQKLAIAPEDLEGDFKEVDRFTVQDSSDYIVKYQRTGSQQFECIFVDVQIQRGEDEAESLLKEIRDAVSAPEALNELHIETFDSGIDDAFASKRAGDPDNLCDETSDVPGYSYGINVQRGNVLVLISVWTLVDQGPERAISLAQTQARRIETALRPE
jgi:hypothetical protein